MLLFFTQDSIWSNYFGGVVDVGDRAPFVVSVGDQ
jgi:hypothetical protein